MATKPVSNGRIELLGCHKEKAIKQVDWTCIAGPTSLMVLYILIDYSTCVFNTDSSTASGGEIGSSNSRWSSVYLLEVVCIAPLMMFWWSVYLESFKYSSELFYINVWRGLPDLQCFYWITFVKVLWQGTLGMAAHRYHPDSTVGTFTVRLS